MSNRVKRLESQIHRKQVKELNGMGYCISAIAKMIGISYAHCKNLYNQE